MKTFLVMFLFSVSMVILVILMDLPLGFGLSWAIKKQIIPFKVTEETEVTILIIFAVYFIVKGIVGFINKKLQQSNSQ